MEEPLTRADVRADARNRALRTFWQGLGIDVLIAVAAVLLAWADTADLTSREAWAALGLLLAKTLLITAASFVMRLKMPPPAPADTY